MKEKMQKKFNQSQVAVIVAIFLALGLPVPKSIPEWKGHHIEDFKAAKDLIQCP